MRLLERLWSLLPDGCEVKDCCRKGVLGNENRIPFPDIDSDFYVVMCDYCSTRYHSGETMVIEGLPLHLVAPDAKVVPILNARRKARERYDPETESG